MRILKASSQVCLSLDSQRLMLPLHLLSNLGQDHLRSGDWEKCQGVQTSEELLVPIILQFCQRKQTTVHC